MKQSIAGPFHGLAALSALLLVVAAHREAVGQGGAARLGRAGLVIEGGKKVRRMGGAVVSSINVENRPLKEVLIYLSQRSGYNIIPQNERTGDILVSLDLRNVHWETVLNVLAAKYKLIINRRDMARHRIIVIDSPERISYNFPSATLSTVIQTIADLGHANIIMGQALFLPPLKDTKVKFKFKDVPWRTALELVLKTNNLVLVEEDFGVLRVASPEELKEQLETRIFSLGYLTPSGSKYTAVITSPYIEKEREGAGGEDLFKRSTLIHVIQKVVSDKGKVVFEKRTNSLIVTDSPAKLDVIQRLVETLDVPPKQVHLSLRLIELNDDDIERVGMDWEGAAGKGLTFSSQGPTFSSMFPFVGHRRATPVPPGYGNVILPPSTQPTGNSGFSPGTLDFSQLQAVLHLIRTQTRGRVIQAPQLIVLDNEEATIQIGELIRYAEASVQILPSGGSAASWREADRSPVNLGIQMLVIPHVTGPDNNIILTIIPKTEDFTSADVTKHFLEFESNLGSLKLPQTTQRIVVTKMMLRNGETGVIAGLRKETEGVTIKKVPFLGDIPILGWLFRFRSQTRTTQDLLIFITPRVIDLQEEDALSRRFATIEESMGGAFGREEGSSRFSAEDFR